MDAVVLRASLEPHRATDCWLAVPSSWMVFLDSNGLGTQIALQLRSARSRRHRSQFRWQLPTNQPREIYDPSRSPRRLRQSACGPDQTKNDSAENHPSVVCAPGNRRNHPWKTASILSFYSLLFLAQAMGDQDMTGMDIAVISDRLHSVSWRAGTRSHLCHFVMPDDVIPKEFPGITCRNIDIDLNSEGIAQLAVQDPLGTVGAISESVIAIRHGERWIRAS